VLVSNAPAPTIPDANAPNSSDISGVSGSGRESKSGARGKSDSPTVIRVRSGDLHYSEGERLARFQGGSVGLVTAETTGTGGTTTVVSQEAEVKLAPAAAHAGPVAAGSRADSGSGPANSARANSSIDRLTSHGHVVVDWPGRRGTGEKLVYLGENQTFTLTGSSGDPPRITDQARGSVTGNVLIYHSRDGSVTVEGDGGKTETDTRSRK
jgi:lipopolysaccharide export system protein LptA